MEPILPRIATGDQAAVNEFVTRYSALVISIARKLLRLSDIDDAVQEVFIALWKSAHQFDASKAKESTFVGMVARRRLIDFRRKQGRTPAAADILDSDVSVSDRDAVEKADEAASITRHWSRLRVDERQVLEMSIYRGLTYSEISEDLGKPLGTIKSLARRGLASLRELHAAGTSQQSAEVPSE